MELQFKREYISKKQYAVGELQALLGYAMEVIDLRTRLQDGKLEPGESCMLLFGITPEEYAWKDSDTAKLDHLADKLRKNVPADRLIACQVRSILGKNVSRSVKPLTGESIDSGEFARLVAERSGGKAGPVDAALLECRRLQNLCAQEDAPEGVKLDLAAAKRELCARLRDLDTLYVAYDVLMKGQWPSIGYDMHVEIFTTLARAENMQRRIREAGGMEKWRIRKIERNEIDALILKLAGNGVQFLRIDNGFAAVELTISDLHSGTAPANADLRLKLIATVQFALRYKYLKDNNADRELIHHAFESTLTMRNFSERKIGNTLLYTLCLEKNTTGRQLCTRAAAQKLGDAEKQITPAAKNVILKGPGGRERFLAVFTTPLRAAALAERLHEDTSPVAMCFDDIAERARSCDGVIIDPESLSYRVAAAEYDRIFDLRSKPPQVVRIKPESEPDAAPLPTTAAADPDSGSLPDPDLGNLPNPDAQQPSASEAPSEMQAPSGSAPESAPPENKKKGFFRKIFGK